MLVDTEITLGLSGSMRSGVREKHCWRRRIVHIDVPSCSIMPLSLISTCKHRRELPSVFLNSSIRESSASHDHELLLSFPLCPPSHPAQLAAVPIPIPAAHSCTHFARINNNQQRLLTFRACFRQVIKSGFISAIMQATLERLLTENSYLYYLPLKLWLSSLLSL